MKIENMSTDRIIQIYHWIDDRAAYRRACGITAGAAYAEEEKAWSRCRDELLRWKRTEAFTE